MIVIKRFWAGALLIGLSAGAPAWAQEFCRDPETRMVDESRTKAWIAQVEGRDLQLMEDLSGVWTGETTDPDGAENLLTVDYSASGTFTLTYRKCAKGSKTDCSEVAGRGSWAASRDANGLITEHRHMVVAGIQDLCQSASGKLQDPDTFLQSDGGIARRVR